MAMPDLPLEGSCRCGAVRIRVTKPPLFTSVCHCHGCQKMSSSAYSLTAGFPADGFEVIEGEPVLGGVSKDCHYFCPSCMSWMFTRPPGVDFIVNVRPTMLEDTAWFTPFMQTYTSTKLPWVSVETTYSYEEFPRMEDFQRLAGEFAGQSSAQG